MEEKDFKRFMIPVTILVLAILGFMIIKPLFISIGLGLLFAYIFYPLHKKLGRKLNSETASAWIIVAVVLVIILLPILILMPMFVKQLFEIYLSLKNADFPGIFLSLFPSLGGSTAMSAELAASISHFSSTLSNLMLSLFQNTIMSIPEILFGIIIMLFVFYFALKEGHNVKDYFSAIFPFPKELREKFYKKFDQVTSSVIYGHVLVGFIQGIIGGLGYYMLGIPHALLLTVLTVIVGILPILGPPIVWIPVTIFLYLRGDTQAATLLLIFSIATFPADSILRPRIVSKKAEMNPAIALIGMIGGTYAFGVIGFFVGPLLLAYLILIIEVYKNKKVGKTIVFKEVRNESSEKKHTTPEVVI